MVPVIGCRQKLGGLWGENTRASVRGKLFAQNPLRTGCALTAISCDAKAFTKIGQGRGAQLDRLANFSVGDGIANTDIHRINAS